MVVADSKGRVVVPVPFDPDAAWGKKERHHITGTVSGMGVRGVIDDFEEIRGLLLGPAWRQDCGIAPGDPVSVVLEPEGPQRDGLPDDVAAALGASPEAGEFFDSLAQFYRKAYLKWIDGTKRRPEVRVERIAEMVTLLRSKQKERP
ncbi:MAG: YdeI/OmpD-associated family protein [Acidimicrobiia bacterium]